jgi:uncharacterized protein (DUF305 family)
VRRRLGSLLLIAVVAAGCATPTANRQPTVNDQTDVWFAQHMVPHLLQDTSIAYLSRDELTDPDLARLADRIHRRSQHRRSSSWSGWPSVGSPLTATATSGATACGAATWNGCPASTEPRSMWPSPTR